MRQKKTYDTQSVNLGDPTFDHRNSRENKVDRIIKETSQENTAEYIPVKFQNTKYRDSLKATKVKKQVTKK